MINRTIYQKQYKLVFLLRDLLRHFLVIAKHDVFLQCNGKPLSTHKNISNQAQNSLSLNHVGITNNATIFVSRCCYGGCFSVSFSILIVIFVSFLLSGVTCGVSLCVVPFLIPLLFILPIFCL